MSELNCWGITTVIDLFECNVAFFKESQAIERYINELIDLIEMKKFGQLDLVNFGANDRVKGFTAIQKIETSSIVCHFSDFTGYADIIIDSCKPYHVGAAAYFSKAFFSAKKMKYQSIKRGKGIY